MTKTAALPSYRETASFIANEAFYNARNTVRHMRLYDINDTGNTFTIAPATLYETQITRKTDGTLQYDHDQGHLLLYQPPYSRRDIFTRTWWHILERARDTLKTLVKTTLDTALDDSLGHLDHLDIEPQATTGQKSLDKVLFHTDDAVRSTVGHGYLQNPASLGYGTLRNFIGKERVNNVLSIAGPKATLEDYNVITRNQDAFTKAAEINPNAVTLWLLHRRNNYLDQTHSNPVDILEEAKQIFINAARDGFGHNSQELWETASHLNHAAVVRHTQSTFSILLLASIVHGANATPSYTALTTLLHVHGHQKVAHPFIRESEARLKQRGKTQAQLATQYMAITNPHLFPDIVHIPDVQRAYNDFISQTPDNAPAEWQEILELFPSQVSETKEIRDHRGRPKTPPKKGPKTKQRPMGQGPKSRPKAPSHKELAQILDGPAQSMLENLMASALTLHTVPGTSVQLNAAGRAEPVLAMMKHPDNTISHSSDDYLVNGNLPDPTTPYRTNIHWTTRGLKQSIIAQALHQHLMDNWDQMKPRSNAPVPSKEKLTTHIRQRLEQASAQDPGCQTDAQLSSDLIDAVASLVDPALHQALSETCWTVNIETYNMAAQAKDIFTHLHDTNPGALAWLMNTDPPRTPPEHPGELITKAKHSLQEAGLQPTSWKSAATLDPHVMKELATALTKGELHPAPRETRTKILNIIAANNITTSPDNIYPTLQALRRIGTLKRPDMNTTDNPLIETNSQACAAIILKAEPDRIGDAYLDVADYARDMTIQSNPITCRNWNTLLKASDQRHRETRAIPTKHKWNKLLDHQNSYYRAWPTALDTHQDGDHTIIPLSSEYDLYHESLDMDHCVIGYGDNCAIHNSRIFSIIDSKDNRKLATTELVKQGGEWTPLQTRGRNNHPPRHKVLETVQRLAQRYQEETIAKLSLTAKSV